MAVPLVAGFQYMGCHAFFSVCSLYPPPLEYTFLIFSGFTVQHASINCHAGTGKTGRTGGFTQFQSICHTLLNTFAKSYAAFA